MTDEKDNLSPEQLAQLMERYKAITQGIATPIAPQQAMAPGEGVTLPKEDSSQSDQDKSEEKDDISKPIDESDDNKEDSDSSDDKTEDSEKEEDTSNEDKSEEKETPEPSSSNSNNQSALSALLTQANASNSQFDPNKLLLDAQQERDRRNKAAQLIQAGSLIGHGLAGAGGATVSQLPQDTFSELYKNASIPVEDFKAKLAIQGDDPNSEVSKAAQDYAKKLGINLPGAVSANTLFKILPIQEKFQASQETNATRRDTAKYRADAIAAQRENAAALREQNQATKATDQQNKALTSAQQLLESARGNPAAAQAEKDLYSAQKATSLANLYGDPNKLSLPQVKLLASEIGKIAAGGVSTQSELEGITPNTLTGRLSQYVSNLTNSPTPANAAAFVKQYQDYTKELSKDAKKVIQDKYGRVIEARKGQLGDTNYNALKDQYLNRFNVDESGDKKDSNGFDLSNPKDLVALKTIMNNNPGISQQEAINALVAHKKDQGL